MLCEDLPSRSSLLLKKQTLEEKIALAFSNTSSLCDLFHARVKHCLSHMVVFSLCYMVLLGLEMVWAAKKNSYSFDELGLMTVIAISLLAALQSCQILSRLDVGVCTFQFPFFFLCNPKFLLVAWGRSSSSSLRLATRVSTHETKSR